MQMGIGSFSAFYIGFFNQSHFANFSAFGSPKYFPNKIIFEEENKSCLAPDFCFSSHNLFVLFLKSK
jgi:hypothetical protein